MSTTGFPADGRLAAGPTIGHSRAAAAGAAAALSGRSRQSPAPGRDREGASHRRTQPSISSTALGEARSSSSAVGVDPLDLLAGTTGHARSRSGAARGADPMSLLPHASSSRRSSTVGVLGAEPPVRLADGIPHRPLATTPARDSGDGHPQAAARSAGGDRSATLTPDVGERLLETNRDPTLDPFRLDGEFFEYITHREHHGEAFVGYRVQGHPMVLFSLVDGSPLVSLHVRARSSGAHAFIARHPDQQGSFLGVVSTDNVAIELVMTNLTTEDVIMFDIGGAPRVRDDEFWEHNDRSFWSGGHRNDQRLNRSNILWPMQPNCCLENNLHFQATGERREILLCAQHNSSPEPQDVDGKANGEVSVTSSVFPLIAYPRHGSRTSAKFAQTAWSCPESLVVVGTPALLTDVRSGRNIQPEAPTGRATSARGVEGLASSLGLSADHLLEALGVDRAFLDELPEDLQHEVLAQQLSSVDPARLRVPESPRNVPVARGLHREHAAPALRPTAAAERSTALEALAVSATPAQVAVGGRLGASGAHGLLIERFDFERLSASATLALGVDERVRLFARQEGGRRGASEALAELRTVLTQRIDELACGRTEALRAEVQGVFPTAECVICLCGEPPPDVVLYQCGHRCAHLECLEGSRLRRCPLCRSPIAALLPCG